MLTKYTISPIKCPLNDTKMTSGYFVIGLAYPAPKKRKNAKFSAKFVHIHIPPFKQRKQDVPSIWLHGFCRVRWCKWV